MAVYNLTSGAFEKIAQSGEKTVVIDFWAPWCGPCKMLSPIIDKISEERDDILFCKVNVDDEPELAKKFGIMSIPTVVLLENGSEKKRTVGFMPEDEVLEFLNNK